MKKNLIYLLALMVGTLPAYGQNLTQTVRGTLIDADSKVPLLGVQVVLLDSDPLRGAVSDGDGRFRLEQVPVGRATLQLHYLGYETVTLADLLVISGKETVINVGLREAIAQMEEVVVTAIRDGEPLSEMALISSRSISAEETNRYAGGFNDPARILSNFAGVNNSQDGSADIIVRGNAPKYLQWRLEGMPISSPNHFADPSGVGANSISALNNNILATSDFYTGVFPAEFGDALSGAYDVRLRTGNNERFEGIVGAGIVGTDLTLEGPFRRDYDGSFLVNYRFTTVGLVSKLGLLDDLGGVPEFQDGAFKLRLPTQKMGEFSLFGLAGASSIRFEDVDPGVWLTPSTRGRREDITEDYTKKAHLLNTGLNHSLPLGHQAYLATSLTLSTEGIEDVVFETLTQEGEVVHARNNFNSRVTTHSYRANVAYHHKLNARNTIELGARYTLTQQENQASQVIDDDGTAQAFADFEEGIDDLSTYLSWKHRLNPQLSFVLGLHNRNVLFNDKHTIEPRLAAQWRLTPTSTLSLGYGLHSRMESVRHYFAQVELPDGSMSEPNRDLDLLKAHHFVLGYERRFRGGLRAKAELYYQDLYDLPVENDATSSYATINESLALRSVDLVNAGTGVNYGIELTVEKAFSHHYYFLVNASLFESKYTALDGVERNTAFNSNFLVNLLFGKEFTGWGKKENQTFGLNGKVFVGGGRRIIPLLRDEAGNLAVEPATDLYYDESRAFENYLDEIYTLTLSLSYKWHRTRTTHELFLNIDNLTNNKPRLAEYYDPAATDNIGYLTPIGAFPNFMYRLYF